MHQVYIHLRACQNCMDRHENRNNLQQADSISVTSIKRIKKTLVIRQQVMIKITQERHEKHNIATHRPLSYNSGSQHTSNATKGVKHKVHVEVSAQEYNIEFI